MKLSKSQLAEFYGVSTRTISNWLDLGCPTQTMGKIKVYESVDVIAWREMKAVEAAGEGLPTNIDDKQVLAAQRRIVLAKAESAESAAVINYIERARQEKRVILREIAQDLIADMTAEYSRALDTSEKKWLTEFARAKTEEEVKVIVKKMTRDIRLTISNLELKQDTTDE